MLTARGQKRDREMAERYGASRFMTKPFSNAEVLDAVRDLVGVMSRPRPTRMFLERRTYRRRRLMDAARLLPIVGVLLFLVPLLWAPDRGDRARPPARAIYVFAVWFGLIVGGGAVDLAPCRAPARSRRRSSGRGSGRMISFNVLVAGLPDLCRVAVRGRLRRRTAGAARGDVGWLRSPLVYTLSLSIYCTAWTFYGAVGYAVRSGLEFVTIYLGPDAGDGRLVVGAAQAGADRAQPSGSPRSPT